MTVNHHMRAQAGPGTDAHVRPNHAVGADLDPLPDLRSLCNHRRWMDATHELLSPSEIMHIISASEATAPSTVICALKRAIFDRSFVIVTSIRH